jgi:hypothetical protein
MNYTNFLNPSKDYREVPFWSWNDDLDVQELRRQIALMDEAGWGGFFMHSRVGLRTPYLGRQWMECVRACIDEAGKRGMGAWLYDEDKWPSGFAGGLAVTDPAHRAQALVCLVDNKPALLKEHMAAFVAKRAGGDLDDFRRLDDLAKFNGDCDSLVQFYVLHSPLGNPWFNGYNYLNTLEPQAVRAFLDSTHEVYSREIGEYFGKAVPGVFTDEPAYANTQIPNGGVVDPGTVQFVPWVDGLEQVFQQRWGYDLMVNLPCLFFDTGPYPQVRYHFWRLVTERFVQAFSKQVYEWCDQHNLALTGHYLLEDAMWVQTRWIGAAMPHYEYEHIPGIDKLARNLYTPLTVKQLDSAVCQLGKPRALCESYGAVGQDFSLAGRKWIGDWLYVLGVNFNNPHLSLYSMRGERKRDHPANLYYQQPWWPENRLIADYFTRLSYILSQGQRVVDILVLHPIGSAWSRYRPDAMGAVTKLDNDLAALERTLLCAQRDFHYGDEMLMERYARVARRDGKPVLKIGKMQYTLVIVPSSHTWTPQTARLLRAFMEEGGNILALPPWPTELEGRPVAAMLPLGTRPVKIENLVGIVGETLPFDVRLDGCPQVWYQHRREGDTGWYFLVNTSLEKGVHGRLELRGRGRLEDWDPATGKVTPLAADGEGEITSLELDLAPSGSRLLVLHRDQPPFSVAAPVTAGQTIEEIPLGETWELALNEPNALTLDRAAYRLGEGAWSEPLYILDTHRVVGAAGIGTNFSLRFSVEVDVVPQGALFLVIENPERFAITVNEQPIELHDLGWWRDISFRKVAIDGKLRTGTNTIVMSGTFNRDSELESIYLVGDFGISSPVGMYEGGENGMSFYRYAADFRLNQLPKQVREGNLAGQGLPFFAGRLKLAQTVHLDGELAGARLAFGEFWSAVVRVTVNGMEAGVTAWPPYEVELGEQMKPGSNRIEIELASTLRNLLGPHHLRGGDPVGVGPDAFRASPRWTDDYIMAPFGVGKISLRIIRKEG